MKLSEIIKKSRRLVNKLRQNEDAKFQKEDYFMICVSLFVAKKESVMKKNNKTSTLHFDYEKDKNEYQLMDALLDEIIKENPSIMVNIPGLGQFDLTKPGCFDGIENLSFPFNLKIEVENFNGNINELNEIKRVMWIYSKIRDSFVHGEKYEFDIDNNRIIINNELSDEFMGSFKFKIKFTPELLSLLCGYKIPMNNVIDNEHFIKTKNMIIHEKNPSEDLVEKLLEQIEDINNTKELKLITNILNSYAKAYSKLTRNQKDEYLDKIVEIIVLYASRSRENNEKSRQMMKILSEILSTDNNDYYSVLYSHMIFVFTDTKDINIDGVKTTYFEVENDYYSRIITNEIIRTNKALNNLLNTYIDPVHTRDVILARMNKLIRVIEMRNKEIINSLRNGITHKNININGSSIEIFDRQDNTDENSKVSFRCKTTFEKIDKFLQEIEMNKGKNDSLNIEDFLNEIRMICGDGEHIDMFCLYINTFAYFLNNKQQINREEEIDELLTL